MLKDNSARWRTLVQFLNTFVKRFKDEDSGGRNVNVAQRASSVGPVVTVHEGFDGV